MTGYGRDLKQTPKTLIRQGDEQTRSLLCIILLCVSTSRDSKNGNPMRVRMTYNPYPAALPCVSSFPLSCVTDLDHVTFIPIGEEGEGD